MTLRRYRHDGRLLTWRARQHRKGLQHETRGLDPTQAPFWHTERYNWLTGAIFAVGAFLFMTGCVLTLISQVWEALDPTTINSVFFLGSIPFTTAGYLQLFQAANAGPFAPARPASAISSGRIALIGWHPESPGWLSTLAQFVGTVAFNLNTFDAIYDPSGWRAQDLVIWIPGMIGSLLFLISGYLAYIEAGHAYWSWRPKELAWWIVFVNLVGCIAFMTAAILAYVPAGTEPAWVPVVGNVHLWFGALCFFVGAILLMRESRDSAHR
ncbi:hypothetical protein [Microbaculum marinum]|uniref:YrhK domain-containing protein n=1 Tax=Microbaculum marinum TaxID=1764581 RepID=A0AAW9RPR6_9HYPH